MKTTLRPTILAALGLLATGLSAATHTVDTLIDENGTGPALSLREAISAAVSGDTIEFAPGLSGGTIELVHSYLRITKSLEIDASALPDGIRVSGGGTSQIIQATYHNSSDANFLTLRRIAFVDGFAPGTEAGGGVQVSGPTVANVGSLELTFVGCHFEGNRTNLSTGGAIAVDGRTSTALFDCSFIKNAAPASSSNGHAITLIDGLQPTIIRQCTFACHSGRVIVSSQSTPMEFSHCTISRNSTSSVIIVGEASFDHCIVAGNSGANLRATGVTSLGYNIFGDPSPSYADATDILTNEPGLLEPMRRGGFTKTCGIRPDSPACDAGNPNILLPATDQRGFLRFRDGDGDFTGSATIDIGAFELGETVIVDTATDELFTLPDTGTSLREALVIAAGKGDGTRIAFTGHTSFPLSLGELAPTSTVWIDGDPSGATSIFPNPGPSRVFNVGSHTLTLTKVNPSGGTEGTGGNVWVAAGGRLNMIDAGCYNGSAQQGGGIFSNGSVFLSRTRVRSCTGTESSSGANDALGAAIFSNGSLEMVNSVITDNNTEGETGGIRSTGEVLLNHCTVTLNRASSGTDGVGLHQTGGRAELRYCVFEKNLVNGVSVNFSGTILSGAINAEDGNQLTGPNDLTGIDPKLYLGVVPDPFESPLIDRGESASCQKTDFYGNQRITKGFANTSPSAPAMADLGACETPRTLYVTTIEDQNSGATADGVSLREAIALANSYTDGLQTQIAFAQDLCGKRIQLLSSMGGTLELRQKMHIRGPKRSASSIEISGPYDDPTRAVTAADFPVFTFLGPPPPNTAIDLSYLTISRGATLQDGGGLRFPSSASAQVQSRIFDVVVKDCRATNGGGASVATAYAGVDFRRCAFSGNMADAEGGAISNMADPNGDGPATIVDTCTFVGNRASEGGAISDRQTGAFGEIRINQSTFTANIATVSGGALSVYDGGTSAFQQPEIRNILATGNFPDDIALNSGTMRILGSVLGNDPTGDPSNLITTDAKLGAFGDHGGPTPTVALLPGSPAIDFGGSGDDDPRGIAPQDGDGNGSVVRDAGAYEFRRPTIFVTTTADENGAPADPNTSLREAIAIAQPGDVIQFDLPLNGQTITLGSELLIAPDKFVEIDASPLPSGVTISGGGLTNYLFIIHGYAQFKGLVFTGSMRNALLTVGTTEFAHMRAAGCHFTACGDVSSPDPANLFGGVLNIGDCASAELVASSFFGNRGTNGGVIWNTSRFAARHCVFSNNSGPDGGVILNASHGLADFSHCTFLDNSAAPLAGLSGQGRGKVAYNEGGATSFHACIFDEDTTEALFVSDPVLPGTFTSRGSNIARSNDPVLNKPTDLIGTDPQLGPELIHRVVRYHVPDQFSPAVEFVAANPFPFSDIRGVAGPLDGNGDLIAIPDAGAVEAPPLILVDIPNDENDGIQVGSGTSLRDAVEHVNNTSFPVEPVIGFAPFLSGQEISVQSLFGGEILVSKGTTIDASNLAENPVISGEGASGGFRVFQFNALGQTVRLRAVNVRGGFSSSEGAGIWITNSTSGSLVDCEIFENHASTHGGAVAVTLGAGLSMENCAIVLNRADGFGGGLFVSDASAQVIQSTFALNHSVAGGGALADLSASDIDLRHCTFGDNTADAGGGGIDLQHTARATHTILARNLPVNFHDRGTATLVSLGYNLDDGTNGRFIDATDMGNVGDAELGGIQFVGGRTSVMPLMFGSPAVDSGDPSVAGAPPFDQTGFTPRVLDGDYLGAAIIDRGAFELDVLTIDPDLDGDEIPNQWEVQNGYNPKDFADALVDDDGDGQNTLAEYIAGTLPGDSKSYLRIVSLVDPSPDRTSFLIEWTSNDFISDLVYDVYVSTDLVGWTLVASDLPAMPLSVTTTEVVPVSQTPVKPKLFFRVAARRVPPI